MPQLGQGRNMVGGLSSRGPVDQPEYGGISPWFNESAPGTNQPRGGLNYGDAYLGPATGLGNQIQELGGSLGGLQGLLKSRGGGGALGLDPNRGYAGNDPIFGPIGPGGISSSRPVDLAEGGQATGLRQQIAAGLPGRGGGPSSRDDQQRQQWQRMQDEGLSGGSSTVGPAQAAALGRGQDAWRGLKGAYGGGGSAGWQDFKQGQQQAGTFDALKSRVLGGAGPAAGTAAAGGFGGAPMGSFGGGGGGRAPAAGPTAAGGFGPPAAPRGGFGVGAPGSQPFGGSLGGLQGLAGGFGGRKRPGQATEEYAG